MDTFLPEQNGEASEHDAVKATVRVHIIKRQNNHDVRQSIVIRSLAYRIHATRDLCLDYYRTVFHQQLAAQTNKCTKM